MVTFLLIVHLLLAIVMVVLVLLQRSEGGGLGIGGGGGFMTGRATANLLTRATGIIAGSFMATSLILAILSSAGREDRARSIMDQPASTAPSAPVAPSGPFPSTPSVPTPPSAPVAR